MLVRDDVTDLSSSLPPVCVFKIQDVVWELVTLRGSRTLLQCSTNPIKLFHVECVLVSPTLFEIFKRHQSWRKGIGIIGTHFWRTGRKNKLGKQIFKRNLGNTASTCIVESSRVCVSHRRYNKEYQKTPCCGSPRSGPSEPRSTTVAA